MKKRIFLISLALILLTSLVYAQDFNEYQNLVIKTDLFGKLEASISGKLTVNLTLLPKEDSRQHINSFSTFPQGTVKDTIFYSWYSDVAEFGWNSTIRTNAFLNEIKHIPFPLSISEYQEYTRVTEYIDINPAITKQANELVSGKTDLFEAVFKLGNFVYTNMTYDKNYIDSVQKASWIFENKKGVCDEYSLLFVSLVRSLGIPARYVSGTVYSADRYSGFFGNHAWTEVYFPDYGWIPFDPTFGQLGWIDSTHVALSKTASPDISVLYTYQKNVNIQATPLNITADIIDKTNKFSDVLRIRAEPIKQNVLFYSFLPLKIQVENLNDFYVPANIFLTKAPSDVLGKNSINVLLGPKETQTVFFILRIPGGLSQYEYTSSIEVKDNFNDISETSIKFSNHDEFISLNEAQIIVNELTTKKQSLIYNVDMNCSLDKEFYYTDENMRIDCIVKSESNTFLENLQLCVGEECYGFELPINSEIEKLFTLPAKNYIIKLKNSEILESEYISKKILQKPDIKIIDIDKTRLNYNQDSLKIKVISNSSCYNIILLVNSQKAELEELEGLKEIQVDFPGKDALKEKLEVIIECSDLLERKYSDEKTFDIKIENIPWYGQIKKWFVNLF